MKASINNTNIKHYLQQPEGETLEFKSKFTSDKQICSIISAFANTKGGILIIGFHEVDGIIGVSASETILIQKAFSLLTNPPEYITYNVTIDNKQLLIVEVKKNTNSLTSFQGALLYRSGESIVHMSTDKVEEFFPNYNDSNFPRGLVDILLEMNQTIKKQTDEITNLRKKSEHQTMINIIVGFIFCIVGVVLSKIFS